MSRKNRTKSHRFTVRTVDADGFAAYSNPEPTLLVLQISRAEIESGNIASALERLYVLTDDKKSVLRYRESMTIMVSGYDTDPRDLPEIPEIRNFFCRLVEEFPHWSWFLLRDGRQMSLLLSLICPVDIVRDAQGNFGIMFADDKSLERQLTSMFERSTHLFVAHEISAEAAEESAKSAVRELYGAAPD